MELFDVNPENYESDIDFFIQQYGEEPMADLTGGETLYNYEGDVAATEQTPDQLEALALFQTLRDMPFKNEGQREQMALIVHQLVKLDHIPEVRVFFRQIGKLLNDLGDNGIIDNSASELEESKNKKRYRYERIFTERAFNLKDDLLTGITYEDLIYTVQANEPTVNAASIKKTFEAIVKANLKDAQYSLSSNMKEIIAEAI